MADGEWVGGPVGHTGGKLAVNRSLFAVQNMCDVFVAGITTLAPCLVFVLHVIVHMLWSRNREVASRARVARACMRCSVREQICRLQHAHQTCAFVALLLVLGPCFVVSPVWCAIWSPDQGPDWCVDWCAD
jgi:hypothetical protein